MSLRKINPVNNFNDLLNLQSIIVKKTIYQLIIVKSNNFVSEIFNRISELTDYFNVSVPYETYV